MTRKIAAMAVALVLAALPTEGAFAHVTTAPTNLTAKKAPGPPIERGSRLLIFGTLKSDDASCRANQVIRLFRKRPGKDRPKGTDLTDAEGEYRFLLRPRRSMRLYTRFVGSVDSSYGHSHTCVGDTSPTKKVKVLR